MSDEPILGYRFRRWRVLTSCVRCGRSISSGVVHPSDPHTPPTHALCRACYALVAGSGPPSSTDAL